MKRNHHSSLTLVTVGFFVVIVVGFLVVRLVFVCATPGRLVVTLVAGVFCVVTPGLAIVVPGLLPGRFVVVAFCTGFFVVPDDGLFVAVTDAFFS